ncbi:MAG: flavohemoglobin expression-modulating QEGLA motif protein [Woeseiaceae bacterium]|nr:flavohemoglobin expression-modulating QEGLA motif protein [Woeseiaceae bacterium]
MNLDRHIELDKTIVAAAKNIKVLSRLSWPPKTQSRFLAGWRRGKPALPSVEYAPADDLDDAVRKLTAAAQELRTFDDPIADYLRDTARSYVTLCDLLAKAGTAAMLESSRALYGMPGDPLSDGQVDNLQAATHFLEQSRQYYLASHLQETDYCVSAEVIKEDLEKRLAEVFPPGTVNVTIDPNLASKAAAGPTRIRLRGDTCFSGYDLEQLLQHEAFVHSLTALNGRAQPKITSLGLGAPRTTGPQEGLATFAELVTGAIDIDRMERIALRVVGIDMAIKGADFIDVFRFFLDAGQPESESFSSAMRVFRGAPLSGGAAFTKDVVYVHGLMEVHTFFRWALLNQRMELCQHFFAGRMTIADTMALAPMFESGYIEGPKYLPPWMTRTNGLAGYLAFSIFASRISVEALGEHHRFDTLKDLQT